MAKNDHLVEDKNEKKNNNNNNNKARAAALQAKRAMRNLGRIHQFERAKISHNCAA